MATPLIGISAPRNVERSAFGEKESMLQVMEYSNVIARAGGRPVLLPPTDDLPEDLLDGFSGLVLSGGGDISPTLYGGTVDENNYGLSPERDAHEVQLIKEAESRGLPVLAICRGLQMVNVVRGGTLHNHIDGHWQEVPPSEPHHDITIDEGSQLAAILGATKIDVNSYHHQGIGRLGTGLQPVAHAGDVIEAFEDPEASIIGVQWHPEHMAATSASHYALFEHLVNEARDRMKGSTS